jgi:hypothetical protein
MIVRLEVFASDLVANRKFHKIVWFFDALVLVGAGFAVGYVMSAIQYLGLPLDRTIMVPWGDAFVSLFWLGVSVAFGYMWLGGFGDDE